MPPLPSDRAAAPLFACEGRRISYLLVTISPNQVMVVVGPPWRGLLARPRSGHLAPACSVPSHKGFSHTHYHHPCFMDENVERTYLVSWGSAGATAPPESECLVPFLT